MRALARLRDGNPLVVPKALKKGSVYMSADNFGNNRAGRQNVTAYLNTLKDAWESVTGRKLVSPSGRIEVIAAKPMFLEVAAKLPGWFQARWRGFKSRPTHATAYGEFVIDWFCKTMPTAANAESAAGFLAFLSQVNSEAPNVLKS